MDPMPRSMVLTLSAVAFVGIVAGIVIYQLTPSPPTPSELADQARQLAADAGRDSLETDERLAGCAGILEGYSRLWSGMVSARYEACLREANLLD